MFREAKDMELVALEATVNKINDAIRSAAKEGATSTVVSIDAHFYSVIAKELQSRGYLVVGFGYNTGLKIKW